ncbi:MAG: class II aldolase/adducin family protein [Chromatiales bacterium]
MNVDVRILAGKRATYIARIVMVNFEREGVIKFSLEFRETPAIEFTGLEALEQCRRKFRALGLIGGRDPQRYDGLGFGNISHRLGPGSDAFIITGTQTGHLDSMGAESYAVVTDCDPARNSLVAEGPVKPSSEAMTHAVIYRQLPRVQAVIHVHSPKIWHQAEKLGLPQTARHVPYGTPEMAAEMGRLLAGGMGDWHTISMAGHEDGIITWGETLEAASGELEALFRKAS